MNNRQRCQRLKKTYCAYTRIIIYIHTPVPALNDEIPLTRLTFLIFGGFLCLK